MYYVDPVGMHEKINIFTNLPLSIMHPRFPRLGWVGEASCLFLLSFPNKMHENKKGGAKKTESASPMPYFPGLIAVIY